MNITSKHNAQSAKALIDQMITTIETYGWTEMANPELVLWEQMFKDDSAIIPELAEELRTKSETAGGWWIWPDGTHSAGYFVSFSEWKIVQEDYKLA